MNNSNSRIHLKGNIVRQSPCKDCTRRHTHCHADCEDYKEFRADQDAYLARRYKERKDEMFYMEHAKRKRR